MLDLTDTIENTTPEEPKLGALFQELKRINARDTTFRDRVTRAYRTRHCVWTGQSLDNHKHAVDLKKEPFPWEGASDTRVRAADELINLDVAVMKSAFTRSKLQASGQSTDNRFLSQAVTELLRYMLFTAMETEMRREIELLAQWRQQNGMAILYVGWDQAVETIDQTFDLEAYIEQAQQGDQQSLAIADTFSDPLKEDLAIHILLETSQGLTPKEATAAVREIRTHGKATYRVLRPKDGRVTWQALKPGDDVLFPQETTNLQDARLLARREWLTETQLKSRILSDNWDEAFVEAALLKKGRMSWLADEQAPLSQNQTNTPGWHQVDDHRDQVEIWHCHYKVAERGGTAIYVTVLQPLTPGVCAIHYPLNYEHGLYPYIQFVREWIERPVLDGRGIGEIAQPWQEELKTQRDFRVDRASITILPPIKEPMSRAGAKLKMGPGVRIPVRTNETLEWFQPPQVDNASLQVETATRTDMERYFGRPSPEVPPVITAIIQGNLVTDWLGELKQAVKMSWQLMQQFMPDEELAHITGQLGLPIGQTRDEIQGSYTFTLEFDPAELDLEFLMKKFGAIGEVVQSDTAGVIDRPQLTLLMMAAIDPSIARRVVKPADAATGQEVDDEQNQLAKLWAGIEPPMKPAGQNFQLRAQVMQNSMQLNPEWQKRYQQDQIFKKLYDARLQHFNFMQEQQQNAQIGRVGAAPALGQPQQPSQ